jgi:D-galactarolactone cycloisomerase
VKIVSVETIHARHSLSRPTGPAGAYNATRQTLAIKLVTDEGLIGWGEAYALDGVRPALDDVVAPLLIGQDPTEAARLNRQMRDATGGNGFAVGGMDIALHDLWGQALGVPVWRLYGEAHQDAVPAYASGLCYQEGRHPSEHWVGEAERAMADGFSRVKMRLGRYPVDEELHLVSDVRKRVPRLMVDAWGAYDLPTALEVGRRLHELDVAWFEEPLPQAGYAGYEELTERLDIAVAGGETLQAASEFKALLNRRAVDIVQPDASICGGIAEMLAVADMARTAGIECVPHTWNGAIMQAAALHVASLVPGALLEVDTTENRLVREMLAVPLVMRDGCVQVPSGPGLGIRVDEDWLRWHAV